MKKLFTLLAILVSVASFGQITDTSYSPFTRQGQMLVYAKTYTGTYKDTATNATTVTLSIVKGKNGHLFYNTNFWTYGYEALAIRVTGTKISGTPAGTVKIQSSTDSVNWADEVFYNGVVDTLQIIDQTSNSKTFRAMVRDANYYRAVITTRGTQVTSWVAFWEFIKPQEISVSK
jgi:hypothetical protein